MVLDMQIFKYVTYELDVGKERKKITLVMSKLDVVYLKGIYSFKLKIVWVEEKRWRGKETINPHGF
jgi:hypothetical protein